MKFSYDPIEPPRSSDPQSTGKILSFDLSQSSAAITQIAAQVSICANSAMVSIITTVGQA